MQALEFTRALKEIVEELKVKDLIALVTPWLGGTNAGIPDADKDQFSSYLFDSHEGYKRLLRRPTTRQILEALQIGELYEPGRLRFMLARVTGAGATQNIYADVQVFRQFYTFVGELQSLLKMQLACEGLLEESKIGKINPSEGILELELIEYADEVGISPKRLEVFVRSIRELHTDLMVIHGIQSDALTFKYFDSGSGTLVGILAGKGIIESLSKLLMEWWDKIRFWRLDDFDRKIETFSKGLTLIETVHQASQNGVITKETGDILKVRILREVNNLTQIGATIPLGEAATVDERQLLTEMRNTKLLGDGTADQSGELPAEN